MSNTPETDAETHDVGDSAECLMVSAEVARKLERERDEWKAKYIQQNKDLGCEMMDPNGTIWDYAKKVQRELTVVTKQRDNFEERLRVELGGHPDSELWGDAGLIAATMRCVNALDEVTEQRDKLAELHNKNAIHFNELLELCGTLRKERDRLAAALEEACDNPTTGNWYREARAALAAWKEVRSES